MNQKSAQDRNLDSDTVKELIKLLATIAAENIKS